MKKEHKKLITYNSFQDKLKNNMFLKKLIYTNSKGVLCLSNYVEKSITNNDFEDSDSDDDC